MKSISLREGGGSCSSSRSPSRRFYSGRRWAGATKGLVARDFKEWFPAAHHSYPLRGPSPSSLSLSLSPSPLAVLSARVFTPWVFRIFFGKRRGEERRTSATCPCPRRTIVLQRQITHLSGWRQNKGSCHGIVSCKKSAFPLRIPSPGANHRIPNSVTFHPPLERFHLVLTIYPKRKIISKNNLVFKSCTYINKTYESKV